MGAIEFVFGRRRMLKTIAILALAYTSCTTLGSTPQPPSSVAAIDWSPAPGAYERHLQRVHENPLFPPHPAFVTPEEVDAARARDRADNQALRKRYDELLAGMDSAPSLLHTKELVRWARELNGIILRAAGIGAPAAPLRDAATHTKRVLLEGGLRPISDTADWHAFKEAFDSQLDPVRPALDVPFLAALIREDPPFSGPDRIPSLLSEDPQTIRAVVRFFSADIRRHFWQEFSHRYVEHLLSIGVEIPGIDEKLAAVDAAAAP